jgi:hypothetical protein
MDEYDGGTIDRQCPHCGQFCKVPEYYRPEFKEYLSAYGIDYHFVGCFADSYCNRCKSPVKLGVEFF